MTDTLRIIPLGGLGEVGKNMRGVTIQELLLYWGGDERGSDFAVPRKDFPVCITIASQCLHAAGVAYAMKLRKQKRAAVCMAASTVPSSTATTRWRRWVGRVICFPTS